MLDLDQTGPAGRAKNGSSLGKALHAKLMREGLRELRARPASVPCRLEMTEAMMDQMLLHEAEREGPGY